MNRLLTWRYKLYVNSQQPVQIHRSEDICPAYLTSALQTQEAPEPHEVLLLSYACEGANLPIPDHYWSLGSLYEPQRGRWAETKPLCRPPGKSSWIQPYPPGDRTHSVTWAEKHTGGVTHCHWQGRKIHLRFKIDFHCDNNCCYYYGMPIEIRRANRGAGVRWGGVGWGQPLNRVAKSQPFLLRGAHWRVK